MSSQADISWSINGIPKGIIKQSLGHLPIMVKSQLCNLHGLTPRELVEHHEEAEVRSPTTTTTSANLFQVKKRSTNSFDRQQEMGGYFIVNGIEKVIRMLIMPRRNYPIAMSRPKWKSRGQGYTQYGEYDRCY